MLSLPANVRVFAARDHVDLRKGSDGLHAIVRDEFGEDALSGNVYVFFNARRDRVKLLVWDRNGFWLLYKVTVTARPQPMPLGSPPSCGSPAWRRPK